MTTACSDIIFTNFLFAVNLSPECIFVSFGYTNFVSFSAPLFPFSGPLVQVVKAWPPNHDVVSSSFESSHFVHIMPKEVRSVSNVFPPRHPLMSNKL